MTVAQFRAYKEDATVDLRPSEALRQEPNLPMTDVNWYEATAFCHWLTKRAHKRGWLPKGAKVSLPSEAEWEKVARGGLALPEAPKVGSWSDLPAKGPLATGNNSQPNQTCPWREEKGPSGNLANSSESGIHSPSAVGCFPGGLSPFGAEELSGNVLEWTRSRSEKYPYVPSTKRERFGLPESNSLVLRGGSCFSSEPWIRCAARVEDYPDARTNGLGFRVAVHQFF